MHSELQDNEDNHSGTINPLTVSFSKLIHLCAILRIKPEANTWKD